MEVRDEKEKCRKKGNERNWEENGMSRRPIMVARIEHGFVREFQIVEGRMVVDPRKKSWYLLTSKERLNSDRLCLCQYFRSLLTSGRSSREIQDFQQRERIYASSKVRIQFLVFRMLLPSHFFFKNKIVKSHVWFKYFHEIRYDWNEYDWNCVGFANESRWN